MNQLFILKNMGFKISWKLITIGLFGDEKIPPSITHSDVIEYLDSLLTDISDQTDNIITLVCEKDDYMEFDRILKEFARDDAADVAVERRKWRAVLLKNLIDTISQDCLQGLLELMEFWITMGNPDDCPQSFPSSECKQSVHDYFTPGSYNLNVNKNRVWLNEEILSIIKLDKA